MQILALLLKVLFQSVIPVLWELREKSNEAIEVTTDPAADDEFWAGEWLS